MKGKKPKHSNRKGRKRAAKKSVALGGQERSPLNMSTGPTTTVDGTQISTTP